MEKSTVAYIYAVTEQGSDDVLYVGLTRNPDLDKRLFYHLYEPCSVLCQLRKDKKKLSIYLLESVDYSEGFKAERRWIMHFLDKGVNLLNRQFNPNYQSK